jgi:shikimate dehydrogenase
MKSLKMALVGEDVSQSLSPQIHKFILRELGVGCSYDLVSVPKEQFDAVAPTLFEKYDAFNVTIPYKLSIMPYVQKLGGDAAVFGAVNTVDVPTMSGFNTDGKGFLLLLENAGVNVKGKAALVLGSGGVGRSVIKKLLDAGAEVFAYDLNQTNLQKVHEEFPAFTPLKEVETKPYALIVNCTGVGMHKSVGVSPVGKELLSLCDTAVDLIYEPKKSEFLRLAEEAGKQIVNGESMLFYQAYYSDCIYLKIQPHARTAKELFEKYKKEHTL